MWGQLLGAGLGAIGGAFGGGGGGEKQRPMDQIPDFLQNQYKNIMGQVTRLPQQQYYPGQTVAGFNQWMNDPLRDMRNYGNQAGGGIMDRMRGAGNQALKGINQGMGYANELRKTGGPQFQYDQGTYDTAYNNLMMGMGNSYNEATRNLKRELNENILPSMGLGAAGQGAGWGTRVQNNNAVAVRGAQDRAADIGAQLNMNAMNQANQNAMSAGMGNLNAANQNVGNIMGMYGRMGSMGGQLMESAYNMGIGNMGQALQAGQIKQGHRQDLLNSKVDRHNFNQNKHYDQLQRQLGLMPSTGGYSPGSPGMSPWEGVLQGAQAGLGIYNAGQGAGWWGGGSNPGYISTGWDTPFNQGSAWDGSF